MRFEEELKLIENDDLKELTEKLILTIPDYFWNVPASSSGLHHPSFASGEGGLYRHTQVAFKILNHILEVSNFTSYERDMMRIAILMHDTRKCGTQEEYEKNGKTLFEHPTLAADIVRTFSISDKYKYFALTIANMIESHMGQWSTSKYSDLTLPIPISRCEKIVHIADYLSSRKDIFEREENINND